MDEGRGKSTCNCCVLEAVSELQLDATITMDANKKNQGDYCNAATPEVVFYHDVDDEGQEKAISKLKHSSARIFTDEVVYEPWHEISCMYFFCEEDKALPLGIQQQLAQGLGPDAVTYKTVGSHSPFLSQVQEVVDGVEYAAEMGQEKEVNK